MPFLFNAANKLGSSHSELLLLNATQKGDYRSEVATFASPGKIYSLPLPPAFNIEQLTDSVSALLSNNFTHVLAPHTAFYKDLIPRIAGKYDMQPLTDITAINVHPLKSN